MSTSLKIAACVALLTACGGGGAKPQIHLDMGLKNPDGMMMQNCQQPTISCNGGCVNPTNDNNNCGSCGNACANNQTCQASTCTGGGCTGTQIMCNGSCIDTSTDNNNCGSCGHACANGQNCIAKKCQGQMGNLTGCNGFLMCQSNCMDATCFMTCFNNTTMNGQNLVNALLSCLDNACPSSMGAICDPNGNTMAQCMTCYTNAQSNNGACVQQLNACGMDKP